MALCETEKHYWTAYPSLLPLLKTDEDRDNLERAACAHQCGRYVEAQDLFEKCLPPYTTFALLAMQFADLQGNPRRKIDILEAALQIEHASEDERLIMHLKLLEARFLAYGQMQGLAEKVREVQQRIARCHIGDLTPLELKAIFYYYRMSDFCMRNSNYLMRRRGTIFPKFKGDKNLEVRELATSLVDRRKYDEAVQFMMLGVISGDILLVTPAIDLCCTLEATEQLPLLYRAVTLKNSISDAIWDTDLQRATELNREAGDLLKKIDERLQSPSVELKIAVLDARGLKGEHERCKRYMQLAEQAVLYGNFPVANIAYQTAQGTAKQHWRMQRTHPERLTAWKNLQDVLGANYQFHNEKSGMDLFKGYIVLDLLDFQTELRQYQAALSLAEQFIKLHPHFAVPVLMELILREASKAAQQLGQVERASQLRDAAGLWFSKCPVGGPGGTIDASATLNPQFHLQHLSKYVEDPVEYGIATINLALAWAKFEWNAGLLTSAQWRKLFQYPLEGEEDPNAFEDLIEDLENRPEDTYYHLYGCETPTATPVFLEYVRTFKEWLLIPGRLPSESARKSLAQCIMFSRYRQSLTRSVQGDRYDESDMIALRDEKALFDELVMLKKEGEWDSDEQDNYITMVKIQNLIRAVRLPNAVERGLITKEAFVLGIADCEVLANRYANAGHVFEEYQTLLQQAQMLLLNFRLFKAGEQDACLAVYERADRLVNSVRERAIAMGSIDDLKAKIHMLQSHNMDVHIKWAMKISFLAFVPVWVAAEQSNERALQEAARKKYLNFQEWTLKSKGRGLADMIFQDSRYAPIDSARILQSQMLKASELSSPQHSDEDTGLRELSISDENPVPEAISRAKIDEMLQEVGEGIVIVDFINVAFGDPGGALIAVLYRKSHDCLPVSLKRFSVENIQRWIERVFGTENETVRPLTKDFEADLKELEGLLIPLFEPDLVQRIKPGEKIIFCVTGAIHRVPMHAIPINGVPLIESHEVVYCQSLPALYHSFRSSREYRGVEQRKSVSIVPTYELPWTRSTDAEEKLLQSVRHVRDCLGGTSLVGPALSVQNVQDAMADAGHIFYFGHAYFDSQSPARSALLLNEAARIDPLLMKSGSVGSTLQDIARSACAKPSLATIIGCGSGATQFSTADDIMGLTSAFFLAGVTTMISTLWRIQADDGVDFAIELYRAIHKLKLERRKVGDGLSAGLRTLAISSQESSDRGNTAHFHDWIDLAAAMRTAILKLRERDELKQPAFHWASFYLTGFWLFPSDIGTSESILQPT